MGVPVSGGTGAGEPVPRGLRVLPATALAGRGRVLRDSESPGRGPLDAARPLAPERARPAENASADDRDVGAPVPAHRRRSPPDGEQASAGPASLPRRAGCRARAA